MSYIASRKKNSTDAGVGKLTSTSASGITGPIDTAKAKAIKAGVSLIVRVANCPLEGIPIPETALHCSVAAVEDCDGPCVYVGTYDNGDIREWMRYRPPPALAKNGLVHAPMQAPVFAPMLMGGPMTFGGCGMGSCGMGGCGGGR